MSRRGSKVADIYQEVRCGFYRSRPWVALLLECSRELCKAVVDYTDALCVGVQCDPCFHYKKKRAVQKPRPWSTPDHEGPSTRTASVEPRLYSGRACLVACHTAPFNRS